MYNFYLCAEINIYIYIDTFITKKFLKSNIFYLAYIIYSCNVKNVFDAQEFIVIMTFFKFYI